MLTLQQSGTKRQNPGLAPPFYTHHRGVPQDPKFYKSKTRGVSLNTQNCLSPKPGGGGPTTPRNQSPLHNTGRSLRTACVKTSETDPIKQCFPCARKWVMEEDRTFEAQISHHQQLNTSLNTNLMKLLEFRLSILRLKEANVFGNSPTNSRSNPFQRKPV